MVNTSKSSEKKRRVRWIVTVFVVTILVSAAFSLLSSLIFEHSGLIVAFSVLFLIVLIGIVFDMVGVAVTAADETPFHAMASRRIPEAREAIKLLRNAARVGSICNDVVGDICGVVSGAAAAVISGHIAALTGLGWQTIESVLLSALVAGLTVGGKAMGKSFAINRSTEIVRVVARILYYIQIIPKRIFCRKKS